jgi:hypothetical protein
MKLTSDHLRSIITDVISEAAKKKKPAAKKASAVEKLAANVISVLVTDYVATSQFDSTVEELFLEYLKDGSMTSKQFRSLMSKASLAKLPWDKLLMPIKKEIIGIMNAVATDNDEAGEEYDSDSNWDGDVPNDPDEDWSPVDRRESMYGPVNPPKRKSVTAKKTSAKRK